MSLEALSRGAAYALAVDASRDHCSHLIKKATDWQLPIKVVCRRAEQLLHKPPDIPFDVVYLDPPYRFDQWPVVMPLLKAWTHPDSHILLEHDKFTTPPAGDTRWYGNTAITWLTRQDLNAYI